MDIEKFIINKLKTNDRERITYIHPIITIEKIAQYISAYANGGGGILLFGVKDDGVNIFVKNSVFNIVDKECKIRSMLSTNINMTFGTLCVENSKLEYIIVNGSLERVYANEIIYVMDDKFNPIPLQIRTVFLSYCQKDSVIADGVERGISSRLRNIKISRDIRDVSYKESFSQFMETIGEHDFVIAIISDNYLKSRNCMYEVVETMRDRKYIDKLFYIIIRTDDIEYYDSNVNIDIVADIFDMDGQGKYIRYWKDKEYDLRKSIHDLEDPIQSKNYVNELETVKRIQLDINNFMSELRDRKCLSYNNMIKTDFKDIISQIK